jgi:hypothetical protein
VVLMLMLGSAVLALALVIAVRAVRPRFQFPRFEFPKLVIGAHAAFDKESCRASSRATRCRLDEANVGGVVPKTSVGDVPFPQEAVILWSGE